MRQARLPKILKKSDQCHLHSRCTRALTFSECCKGCLTKASFELIMRVELQGFIERQVVKTLVVKTLVVKTLVVKTLDCGMLYHIISNSCS